MAESKDRREIGDKSEARVARAFDDAGLSLTPSKGSGQCRGDGDFCFVKLS